MKNNEKLYKHSIRRQLTFVFTLILVLTIALEWLANSILLEKYYTSSKVKALRKAYYELCLSVEKGELDTADFDDSMMQFAGTHNVSIIIISNLYEPLKVYSNEPQSDLVKELQFLLVDEEPFKNTIEKTSDYVIARRLDMRKNTEYLEMFGYLPETCFFLMRIPVESIKESTELANRFLIYVGIISIVISGIVIFFFSRRFSKPILELAEISDKMANMDFEARYTGTSQTEIGLLGNNVNKLSGNLEETISKLKTANVELMRDNAIKEKNDEMRKEFISNVSHEFKTPIALIQGYAEGLKDGIDSEEDRNYYCDVIMDESAKMNTMVNKLLDLNRLEFGNTNVEMVRFDAVSFVKNIVSKFDVVLSRQDIEISYPMGYEKFVWADEYLTEEMLTNYISNAINHCSGEGKKRIDVSFEISENKVKVLVFNTGSHIPEESLPQIWEKFYKVDKARTREYGGSGVGLSIVKAAAEAMGQEYGAFNTEGGVVFFFTLDAA